MSPAEPPPQDAGQADDPAPDSLARRIRCELCLEVLHTRHAWDSVSCRCRSLTLSGPPGRPHVAWIGGPGGGWSDVTDLQPVDDVTDEADPSLTAHGYRAPLGMPPARS